MPAAYDSFDYPKYWSGREYEHHAEVFALKQFLSKIPKIKRVADIGCGYGRLTPYYMHRTKRIVLVDPSSSLLKIARNSLVENKTHIKYVHSRMERYIKKTKKKSFDLILFIRVMHHVEDFEGAIRSFNKLLTDDGYLILEFANKRHIKAVIRNFFKGNTTFIGDIFTEDKRCQENIKNHSIPFYNFHPEIVLDELKKNKFEILEVRSVSNIRSDKCKQNLPISTLNWAEEKLQTVFAKIFFGPSIFVLARKKA